MRPASKVLGEHSFEVLNWNSALARWCIWLRLLLLLLAFGHRARRRDLHLQISDSNKQLEMETETGNGVRDGIQVLGGDG
jgi:hypothetical protein